MFIILSLEAPYVFLDLNMEVFLFAFFGAALTVCLQATFVPFYVRYFVICKNQAITKKHLIPSYILVFLCFVITFALMMWCYPPNEANYEEFKAATFTEFWLNEFPTGPVFLARKLDIALYILLGFVFVSTFNSYTLVLFFSTNVSRTLKHHASSFQQSKILNKQLHWTLIAQAIGPIIVGNIPALCLLCMMVIGYENNYISISISSTLPWVAVVNPMAAIIIMTPYQKRVREIFKLKAKSSSVIAVSTTAKITPKITVISPNATRINRLHLY